MTSHSISPIFFLRMKFERAYAGKASGLNDLLYAISVCLEMSALRGKIEINEASRISG